MSGDRAETRVLVADDDADVREMIAFRLARAGYEVITAADGDEALALAIEHRPEVCVIDVMMPKLNGYELAERLRATEDLAAVKILLLTASVEEEAVDRGYEAGADDYITKPFSPAELLERISAALDRR